MTAAAEAAVTAAAAVLLATNPVRTVAGSRCGNAAKETSTHPVRLTHYYGETKPCKVAGVVRGSVDPKLQQ